MIDNSDLTELKKLYFKNYGINLSDIEATALGSSLLELMLIIAKPVDISVIRGKNKVNA